MDFSDQFPVVQRRVMSPSLSIGFQFSFIGLTTTGLDSCNSFLPYTNSDFVAVKLTLLKFSSRDAFKLKRKRNLG